MNQGEITHIETRVSHKINSSALDALLKVDIKHCNLLLFLKTLKRCNSLTEVKLISSKSVNIKREYEICSLSSPVILWPRK